MRAGAVVIGMLVVFAPMVAGHSGHPFDTYRERYNNNTQQLPGSFDSLIGTQRVNIYVNGSENHSQIAVRMEGRTMTELRNGELDDPTVEVWTDRETLQTVIAAERPRKEAKRQLEQGAITYEVHGFLNTIRLGVVRALV